MTSASSVRLFLCVCGLALLVFPLQAYAALVISRVEADAPAGSKDFVEIANTGTLDAVLTKPILKRKITTKDTSGNPTCKESTLVAESNFPASLAAGQTLRFERSIANNTVILFSDASGLLDSKIIGTACDAAPHEPPLPTNPSASSFSSDIRINELLPNPEGLETTEEFIELFNAGIDTVALDEWTLRDASKTGHYTFPKNTALGPGSFLVLYRPVFKFALNNSNETVSLIDPSGKTVSQTSYGKTKPGASYNFSEAGWRFSRFLTPGSANRFNTLPSARTKTPKKVFVGVTASFSTKTKDADGDALKYVWDFGDGHKSYKRDTAHTYKKHGRYSVSLTISDGSEETVERFAVTAKKYPRPKVRITGLMPNPSGRDTDNEWVEITNYSKKSVRLKNWKIATKSPTGKDFVNHTVLTDITIKPGKKKRLMRSDSRFSLHNTASAIALRNPAGKTVQKFAYKRAAAAPEDTAYTRNTPSSDTTTLAAASKTTSWQWIALAPKAETKKATPLPISTPVPEKTFAHNTVPAASRGDRSIIATDSPSLVAEVPLPKSPTVLGAATAHPTSPSAQPTTTSAHEKSSPGGLLSLIASRINAWIASLL